MKEMLSKAIAVAANEHNGQFDKGGNPYILHPLWVMDRVKHLGEKYMITAILHDVIEDTSITYDYLIQIGIDDKEVIDALRLLDFRGVDYMERIREIAFNDIARQVKLRDLEHNSKITRLKDLTAASQKRIQKYHTAYTYLSKV